MGTDCILIYARGIRLWEASYEGKDGQIHSMTLSVAFQVMTLPPGKFPYFFCRLMFFSKSTLSKNSFRNTIRVPNSLHSDQARHFVGPDLDPN